MPAPLQVRCRSHPQGAPTDAGDGTCCLLSAAVVWCKDTSQAWQRQTDTLLLAAGLR